MCFVTRSLQHLQWHLLTDIKCFEGVNIGGQNINILRKAFDSFNSSLKISLQTILDKVFVESEKKGTINVSKTEYMIVSEEAHIPICCILIKGVQKIVPETIFAI